MLHCSASCFHWGGEPDGYINQNRIAVWAEETSRTVTSASCRRPWLSVFSGQARPKPLAVWSVRTGPLASRYFFVVSGQGCTIPFEERSRGPRILAQTKTAIGFFSACRPSQQGERETINSLHGRAELIVRVRDRLAAPDPIVKNRAFIVNFHDNAVLNGPWKLES